MSERAELTALECPFCPHKLDEHGDGECRIAGDVQCRRCSQQNIDNHERNKAALAAADQWECIQERARQAAEEARNE